MEAIFEFIQNVISVFYGYRYLLMFLGSLTEAGYVMILGGFLTTLGYFNLFVLIVLMTVGYIINGYGWYGLGYFGGAKTIEKWGSHIRLTKDFMEKVRGYFKKHSGKAIVFAKITMGFGIATCVISGALKMESRRFFVFNALGSFIWTVATVMLGYAFGASYLLLRGYIKHIILFFVLFVLSFVIFYILHKFLIKPKLMNTRLRKIYFWENRKNYKL